MGVGGVEQPSPCPTPLLSSTNIHEDMCSQQEAAMKKRFGGRAEAMKPPSSLPPSFPEGKVVRLMRQCEIG